MRRDAFLAPGRCRVPRPWCGAGRRMTLGARVGPSSIPSPLLAGSMGEVYRVRGGNWAVASRSSWSSSTPLATGRGSTLRLTVARRISLNYPGNVTTTPRIGPPVLHRVGARGQHDASTRPYRRGAPPIRKSLHITSQPADGLAKGIGALRCSSCQRSVLGIQTGNRVRFTASTTGVCRAMVIAGPSCAARIRADWLPTPVACPRVCRSTRHVRSWRIDQSDGNSFPSYRERGFSELIRNLAEPDSRASSRGWQRPRCRWIANSRLELTPGQRRQLHPDVHIRANPRAQ